MPAIVYPSLSINFFFIIELVFYLLLELNKEKMIEETIQW